MSRPRVILHADMDAFYASVEQRDQPELRGKPVIVGGRDRRGVVAAASYEARTFGVRSAMPVREALRRCPEAICVRPRIAHYRDVSRDVFAVFSDITPVLQGLSLDEAFLDVSDVLHLHGTAQQLAQIIKQRVREKTQLTVSVGGGPNKLIAKIASDLDKPDGLCIVTEAQIRATLDPLPAARIPGIGPKTVSKLKRAGVQTIADLRQSSVSRLRPVFGRYAERMLERAAGIDNRPVIAYSEDKSISTENTFSENVRTLDDMLGHIRGQAEQVAERVRKKGFSASVVRVRIRTPDFRTITRQQILKPASHDTQVFSDIAAQLLTRWHEAQPGSAVRLLGVGAGGLIEAQQMSLFGNPASEVDAMVDKVRERFGSTSLKRGSRLNE
ncbi:MAG: DNA polymerase IV [Gammaproteobacteria bacterium]